MQFEELRLADFGSYADETIQFDEGLSLITGDNGSGKSTLVRGLFVGLFQTGARTQIGGGYQLADFINDDADSAAVELTFSVDQGEYTITWECARSGEDNAHTRTCRLEGPDGTWSQQQTVASKVAELIGMDADAFSSSVYVQQSDIDELVRADPDERRQKFDNLLGLDKIDEYRKRADEARLGARDLRQSFESRHEQVRSELDAYDEVEIKNRRQELRDEIKSRESEVSDLEDKLGEARERKREAETRLEERREALERKDELTETIEILTEDIERLEGEIAEHKATIDQCESDISDARGRLADLDGEVDEYDLTEAGSAGEAADSIQEKYREVDKKVTRLNQKVETLDGNVADIETDIQDKEAELDELKSEREDAEVAVEDAEADLETAESTLDERKAKRDEAVASVLDIDPVDVDQETESEVEARQADLQKQLQDARGDMDAARQRQDSLEDQIEETESERDSAKAELETIQDRLDSDVDDPEAALRDAIDRADEIGTEFGIEVTPDTIEGALTTEIPAKLDTALNTYKNAADEVGRLKGELRFHEQRLDIVETADTNCPTCGQAVDGAEKGTVQEDIETDVSSARNALADAEATREAARERIDRLNALSAAALEAASLRALANVMGDIEAIEAQLETLQADLDNAKADEANAQAEHERIEDLLAAVDKAVETFDAVDEGQVELAEAESTLDEAERELASVESDIRSIESELSDLESELNDVEQERDEKQTALTDARARRDEVAAARDAAEAAVETHDRISELQRQIDTARERRTDKRTQLTSLESDLDDAQDELAKIKEDIGDTKRDELDSLIDDLDETIDKIEGRVDSIRSEIRRLQNEYGAVNNRLDDLREKRELASAFEDRVEWARSIERDLESLSDVYEEVRTERRDDLIQALQARSNEVFRDLYHSESYSGLRVKPGYQVVLVDAEGTERDPKKASGGESVIATIALRAGVYRVLSDIHGNSSTLPPFILDEPTTYLDDEHVGKIEGVVTNIRQWNVPQVFVVSHDTGLVHDADQELQVSKDPATDRSQVTIRRNEHAADGGRGGAD